MANKTKYNSAVNCNRLFSVGDKQIEFEPTAHIGGVWHGVYSTDDKEEQGYLKGELGVSEMSQKEWDELGQKKTPISAEFNPLPTLSSAKASQQTLNQVEDVGPVQSVVQGKQAEAEKAAEVDLNEALQTGATDRASSGKSKRGRQSKK